MWLSLFSATLVCMTAFTMSMGGPIEPNRMNAHCAGSSTPCLWSTSRKRSETLVMTAFQSALSSVTGRYLKASLGSGTMVPRFKSAGASPSKIEFAIGM